ncbi:MAG: E2F family transcription factor [Candidatus Odinarchaeum yellowstonii]|uniref:E2F family transcription factor n=1 Tax=Odinarchaeota yellowstonii (strain LCB_4) TaxID=1841599 RepID=A0AAF0IBG8_ODILC|nr:MAG: E2F family transcription factor [Candidatus Odinarchaeum yellowstonii]
MKLVELTRKVVDCLINSPKPLSAIEITQRVKIPVEKKRRIYDVLDVLEVLNVIKISRRGNEKLAQWVSPQEKPVLKESLTVEERLEDKPHCVVNVDLVFPSSDYKNLSNPTWQEMMVRDVKRNIKGLLDIIVNEIKLTEAKKILAASR